MRQESSVFFTSWLEAIEELDEKDQLAAFKAITKYQAYHEEAEVSGAPKAVFMMAKPIIDSQFQKRMASMENGKKGGRPKTAQSCEEQEDKADNQGKKPKENLKKPSNNLEKPKPNLNANVNKNWNENKNNEKKNIKKKSSPPSYEEIVAYCKERNNNVDAKRFFDYYSAGGWKDGKGNPIINWKQKMIAVWEKNAPKSDEKEKLPVYDTSLNKDFTEEEEKEILALVGRA